MTNQTNECAECINRPECECVWLCARGRTQLFCRMHQHAPDRFSLEVRRNTRLYGMYQFEERVSALAFAGRLRQAFESNGWSPGPSATETTPTDDHSARPGI